MKYVEYHMLLFWSSTCLCMFYYLSKSIDFKLKPFMESSTNGQIYMIISLCTVNEHGSKTYTLHTLLEPMVFTIT